MVCVSVWYHIYALHIQCSQIWGSCDYDATIAVTTTATITTFIALLVSREGKGSDGKFPENHLHAHLPWLKFVLEFYKRNSCAHHTQLYQISIHHTIHVGNTSYRLRPNEIVIA